MTGTVPVANLAPNDYRYALDAAMTVIASRETTLVLCNLEPLTGEVRQRISGDNRTNNFRSALWLEPMVDTLRADLNRLEEALPLNARLAVIASQPLARLLPERRHWDRGSLGMRFRGNAHIQRALAQAGFAVTSCYGIHTILAIGLNLLSKQFERIGRPDLGDRLHFAARLRYCASGALGSISTVSLLLAKKCS